MPLLAQPQASLYVVLSSRGTISLSMVMCEQHQHMHLLCHGSNLSMLSIETEGLTGRFLRALPTREFLQWTTC